MNTITYKILGIKDNSTFTNQQKKLLTIIYNMESKLENTKHMSNTKICKLESFTFFRKTCMRL